MRIRANHKFLTNSRCIFNLNLFNNLYYGSYIMFKWFKINYSNIFFSSLYYSSGNIIIRPAYYGFSFSKCYKTYFISPFIYKNRYTAAGRFLNISTYNFIFFHENNSIFFFLHNYFSKKIFAKAAGTFCRVLNWDSFKLLFFIKLPSSKRLYFNFLTIGFLGRASNIFYKYQFLSSFKQKLYLKKHTPKVRGIAKNPIDHPNGGRTKVKKPFKTPWGKIAKAGK